MTAARLAARCLPPVLITGALALLPACATDANFTVLGYTTRPNYDLNIQSVRVPVFQNRTLRRGLEFDLTSAVVREIKKSTPFRVVGDAECADTELTGTIVTFNKLLLNRNQLNEVREAETTLGVEVVWRDLRSGEVLSKPPRGLVPTPAPQQPLPGEPPPVPPFLVTSRGDFIPELGESLTTAQKENVDRLAVQIVAMMETPW